MLLEDDDGVVARSELAVPLYFQGKAVGSVGCDGDNGVDAVARTSVEPVGGVAVADISDVGRARRGTIQKRAYTGVQAVIRRELLEACWMQHLESACRQRQPDPDRGERHRVGAARRTPCGAEVMIERRDRVVRRDAWM